MNYLEVNGRNFPVVFEKTLRASSSVRLKGNKVVIKISRYHHGSERDKVIAQFLKWAEKRLKKATFNDFVNPIYEDGGRVFTHNKVYEICVHYTSRQNATGKLKEGFLINIYLPKDVADSKKLIRDLSEKIIIDDQTPYLEQVISELNQLYFKERYRTCRFRRTSGRFGSLSSKKNINISFRLLFAPREVFRYVCVHELAHLKEFNHSKRFWAYVAEAMPDFKVQEKWLRHNGIMLG